MLLFGCRRGHTGQPPSPRLELLTRTHSGVHPKNQLLRNLGRLWVVKDTCSNTRVLRLYSFLSPHALLRNCSKDHFKGLTLLPLLLFIRRGTSRQTSRDPLHCRKDLEQVGSNLRSH